MLKGLFNIIVKEVKELVRDPKILLPMIIIPLIMFPLMGFAIQFSMEAAEESMGEISVAVMDLDGGPVAESLRINLTDWNAKIVQLDDPNLTKAFNYVQESNLTGLIVIPSGFSQNITEGGTSELEVYIPFRGGSIIESTSSSAVSALLSFFESNLVDQRIDEKFTEPPTTVLHGTFHRSPDQEIDNQRERRGHQSHCSLWLSNIPVHYHAGGNNDAAYLCHATRSNSCGFRERGEDP